MTELCGKPLGAESTMYEGVSADNATLNPQSKSQAEKNAHADFSMSKWLGVAPTK